MTIPKAKFAGLTLIAALCAGFTLGLTASAAGYLPAPAAGDPTDQVFVTLGTALPRTAPALTDNVIAQDSRQ